jgi:hypothetical protein
VPALTTLARISGCCNPYTGHWPSTGTLCFLPIHFSDEVAGQPFIGGLLLGMRRGSPIDGEAMRSTVFITAFEHRKKP